MSWRRIDLHIHTPASTQCYRDPNVSYLAILQKAEERGLDVIAFTDHNTISGYAKMRGEIENLTLLESLQRITLAEARTLAEYRRLLSKILVLPGFEFTATLGFHILGIFSERTSLRRIEHILLDLNVAEDKMALGSPEVGATTDVLAAYATIANSGGLVIAAHANSTSGVAMQGFNFGGQTKISYTQDPNLHALEVTDLESASRRRTAAFYNGSKPEYPRRMHCIQGSDAHQLDRDPADRTKACGIGERATEVLVPEVSFAALKQLFLSDGFSRTRPSRPTEAPFDHIKAAREEGPNLVQSFHERLGTKRNKSNTILKDIVAFANTNGGTIYIGVGANPSVPPLGIEHPEEAVEILKREVHKNISPLLDVSIDSKTSDGKILLQVNVPKGPDTPYVLGSSQVYIRQESETSLAVRDEIVRLVLDARREVEFEPKKPEVAEVVTEPAPEVTTGAEEAPMVEPPKTGVEIVDSVQRDNILYHIMKDLRNGNIVQNVTRFSARRLWRYAITQKEDHDLTQSDITWQKDIGLWKTYKRAGLRRYDLVQRDGKNGLHVYYGVTEEGIHGDWKVFVTGD
ncbi:MAG: putative DNA binding domain-containing protein [Chloroflexi bacterium]|nr:putative DNA binding domain-containing protein [Chloroflexota bacterium]